MKRLAIIGVGLIGGSLARAVRERDRAIEIFGIDPAWQKVERSLPRVLDQLLDPSDREAVQRTLGTAELVVLATPVQSIIAELAEMLASGAIVTDCGSTKRAIARAASGLTGRERFVPGHPMAGLPEGGVERADPDLFLGRRWILCPEAASADAVATVVSLVRLVGAEPVELTAEAHDRAVALTSHAPQVLASVLQAVAADIGAHAAAGPGFASATRVAGGSAEIWQDIFASNADEVCWALGRVVEELRQVVAGLEQHDTKPVMALLERARQARRQS